MYGVFGKTVGLVLAITLVTGSCVNLDVENPSPGPENVFGTTQQMIDVGGQLYRDWFNATHALQGPALGLAAAADQITSLNGDAAMRDLATEPRQEFRNVSDYSHLYITKEFWKQMYTVALLANDILKTVLPEEKVLQTNGIDAKPMLEAWSYFIRGIAYGYLGLVFDQATIVDVDTPLPADDFSAYPAVIRFAVASLDSAIAVSGRNSFTLPESYIRGYVLSSSDLKAIASGYAARILISAPRNSIDNVSSDWERIYSYAEQAWTQDLSPDTDNETWKNEYLRNGATPEWAYTDLRCMNLLDPDFPARWPADNLSWDTPGGTPPDSSTLQSPDMRAETDFEWMPNPKPANPYYLNSFYRFRRYDDWVAYGTGNSPEFLTSETNLILAEALAMQDNLQGAIQILNNGTRTQRGQLSPLPADADLATVLKAVFYERDIELMFTGAGLSFFDMRRRDFLQRGTPLHFPVPATDLEILQKEIYTFGGTENADGTNTSNGGWF